MVDRDRRNFINLNALKWARRQRVGGAIGQRILFEIAMSANAKGEAFLGQALIASECEASERTVREWLSKFEAAGLLRKSHRRRETGGRTSDQVTLNLSANAAAGHRQQLPVTVSRTSPSNRQDMPVGTGSNFRLLPAIGAEVTGSICHLIIEEEIHPLNPPSKEGPIPVRDEFTKRGISADTAEALMLAYAVQGTPLSEVDAKALCTELSEQDPEGSALDLLAQLRPHGTAAKPSALRAPRRQRMRQRSSMGSGTSEGGPEQFLSPNIEPEGWAWCCAQLGHDPAITNDQGGWFFPKALTDRFLREVAYRP